MKDMVSNDVQNIFIEFGAYDKEIRFYSEIASKINAKLKDLGEPELCAEAFGTSKLKNILILEDLSASGYQVMPSKHSFNLHETKAILKKLATFHAINAVLQEEQPDIFADFKYGQLFNLNCIFHRKFRKFSELIFFLTIANLFIFFRN